MSQQEINLNSLVDQMKEFVEKKDDCSDKSLLTPALLKMCLRAKDYNIDKAYNLALKYVERFEHKKIQIESKEKLMQALESSIIRVACNKASLRGETIIVFDLCSWIPKELDEELIPCMISIVLDYLLCDELFQINGCFVLFDITGLKLKHLSQIRKKLIKKVLNAFECTVPIRTIKSLFIITADKFSQMVFLKFLKKCISMELREKMIVLKKNEISKLTHFIDSNSLSVKFGGRLSEVKFLNLPILVNEALDCLPGYSFDSGPTTYCCSLLSDDKEEHTETDNETLNENLSKDVEDNKDSKLDLSANVEQSTSGLNK